MSFTCHLCVKQGKSGLGHAPGPNCPIVKNFTCGYCKGKGHTIKHCPILLSRKNEEKARLTRQTLESKKAKIETQVKPQVKPVKRVEQIVNHFGIIEHDSEMPKAKNM